MSLRFDRPVGATGDVKELEYVSALHQTDLRCMRTDGSIRDEDIQLFLMSRYGIDVSVDEVRETVLQGMGGGSGGDDDCIDLMEMVAILLIPTLLKAAQEENKVTVNSKLILPRPGIIRFVLDMILKDVTGSEDPQELTPQLVKDILNAYGEAELARDDKLVNEMVAVVASTSSQAKSNGKTSKSQTTCWLDSQTLARALTYDVELYDIHNEIRVSANYDDVFLTHNTNDSGIVANSNKEHDEEFGRIRQERDKVSREVTTKFTAPSIDFVASTYRSKGLTVILWATFIVTYFAYDYNTANKYAQKHTCTAYNYTETNPWIDNADAISCQIITDLYSWAIVFAIASGFGLLLIGFGSIGNNFHVTWFGPPLLGAVVVFGLSYAPFKYLHYKDDNMLSHKYLKYAALALGMIAVAFHLSHAIVLLVPKPIRRIPGLRRLFAAGTLRGEVQVKQAAAYKLTGMVENARDILRVRDLDGVVDTNFGQGLIAFSKHGNRFREEGGFFWTWTRLFNSELITKEGIWFSARLLASNISQYIVAVFVLLAGIALTHQASVNYNPAHAQQIVERDLQKAVNLGVNQGLVNILATNVSSVISDFLQGQSSAINCGNFVYNQTAIDQACQLTNGVSHCNPNSGINYLCAFIAYNATAPGNSAQQQLGLLAASGFDTQEANTAFNSILQSSSNNGLASLYPSQKYMVVVPMAMATSVAFFVALYLATVYFPSHTATILKLRSGVIPTLRDRNFYRARSALDRVTVITGSMFWGSLISSVLAGGIVGVIIFAFLWQVTVYVVQRLVAITLGILTIVVLKLLILITCRCALYKAFYRRRPVVANITAVTLECSNFALSVGFVFLRLVKFLLSAAIFIGRIDAPFLAQGVGRLGPLQLDSYPDVYRKDILATDAHRHPYIETLGVMYLMKLRYGENFGKRAGSSWRLLFVYALMPWLHKYRIQARPDIMTARNVGTLRNVKSLTSLRVLLTDDDDIDNGEVDDSNHDVVRKQAPPVSDGLLQKKIEELLKENAALKERMRESQTEI